MKYDYKTYARALASAAMKNLSPAEAKQAADRFLSVLQKNGDRRALPKIVAHAESLFMKRSGGHKVTIESARPLSKHAHADILKHLERKDAVEQKVNPSLIAGVRITVNGERELDMSFAHKVNRLFG